MKRGLASATWLVAYVWTTVVTSSTSRDLTPSQLDTVYIEGVSIHNSYLTAALQKFFLILVYNLVQLVAICLAYC